MRHGLLGSACGLPPTSLDTDASSSQTSAGDGDGDGETESGTTTETTTDTDDPPVLDIGGHDSCDPLVEDCDDGEKCVPKSDGEMFIVGHVCVPVMGDQMVGETCTAWEDAYVHIDDCDENGLCWNVELIDDQFVGTCHANCSPACPEGEFCLGAALLGQQKNE